jgi:protein-disulfide isomerase-like protein with CxxC motif
MGRNLTIYFDDECLGYIEKIEGKGTLINNLVKEHFSNDIENLIIRSKNLNMQIEDVNNKIEKIRKLKTENELSSRKRMQQTEFSKQKDNCAQMVRELLIDEKITQEEWEALFDSNGIKLKEALEVCKRFNQNRNI